MSLKFLKNLNGNNTGHFEKYLSSIKSIEDLSISWYPSSGEDFRNIVILNEVFMESQLKIVNRNDIARLVKLSKE